LRRAAQNLLFEPPVRLLIKALLSNWCARRWAFEWAALFDAVRYPAYALGLQTACRYARLSGAHGFTAIEFGVAGGNGLRELSVYAERLSRESSLELRVVGFDAGSGLPVGADYRDAPWLWKSGDFPCDVGLLRSAIPKSTELVLGPIEETFPRWLSRDANLPIGFVAMDVDYFSSSWAVLKALGAADVDSLLPFVSFYFDDMLHYLAPRSTGEYAAISEFNSSHNQRKFDRDDWLREDRPYGERLWLLRMYSLYCFDHPALSASKPREVERLDLVS
jgi:hypothetical protein